MRLLHIFTAILIIIIVFITTSNNTEHMGILSMLRSNNRPTESPEQVEYNKALAALGIKPLLQGGITNTIKWTIDGFNKYTAGGTEGISWKYTDNANDPACMTNWSYYDNNNVLVEENIPNITKVHNNKNWCAINKFKYTSGGTEGVDWKYTDDPNDPACMKKWAYYDNKNVLIEGDIQNITKAGGGDRNWCAIRKMDKYINIGCYNDTAPSNPANPQPRAIPNMDPTRVTSIEHAKQIATNNNATVFGIQAGGELWYGTSQSDILSALKYGAVSSNACQSNLGVGWQNNVWVRESLEIWIPITQPTITQPTTTQPSTTQPTSTQPTTTQPSTTQPSTTQPTSTQPTSTQPTSTQPTSTQPTLTQPSTTEPPTTQPTTTQPTTTQPPTSSSNILFIVGSIVAVIIIVVIGIFVYKYIKSKKQVNNNDDDDDDDT